SGVRPGDRVAVQVEKSPDAILLYLACVRAGAIFLPLNTAYTLNEVEYFVGDAEPRLVICGADRVEAVTAMGPQAETLAAFAARAAGQSVDFAD
ncbi:AMP-binding protein, partial [Klebsiella pneumoniae]